MLTCFNSAPLGLSFRRTRSEWSDRQSTLPFAFHSSSSPTKRRLRRAVADQVGVNICNKTISGLSKSRIWKEQTKRNKRCPYQFSNAHQVSLINQPASLVLLCRCCESVYWAFWPIGCPRRVCKSLGALQVQQLLIYTRVQPREWISELLRRSV